MMNNHLNYYFLMNHLNSRIATVIYSNNKNEIKKILFAWSFKLNNTLPQLIHLIRKHYLIAIIFEWSCCSIANGCLYISVKWEKRDAWAKNTRKIKNKEVLLFAWSKIVRPSSRSKTFCLQMTTKIIQPYIELVFRSCT